jgi:hypothetical protein
MVLLRAWAAALAVLLAGCGYKSEYVPPNDGRARGVWEGDKLVVTGPPTLPRCTHPIEGQLRQQYAQYFERDLEGYYVPPPSRHGPSIVIVAVVPYGPAPVPLVPLLPLPPGKIDGEGAKYLLAAIAVGAIVAFPFVAIGLAAGHPEPSDDVIEAIDQVNRYNDDARRIIALCYATAPEYGGGGQ